MNWINLSHISSVAFVPSLRSFIGTWLSKMVLAIIFMHLDGRLRCCTSTFRRYFHIWSVLLFSFYLRFSFLQEKKRMSSIKPDSFQFSVKVGASKLLTRECCISLMRLALTVWSLMYLKALQKMSWTFCNWCNLLTSISYSGLNLTADEKGMTQSPT